jgi:hypothetical protein
MSQPDLQTSRYAIIAGNLSELCLRAATWRRRWSTPAKASHWPSAAANGVSE